MSFSASSGEHDTMSVDTSSGSYGTMLRMAWPTVLTYLATMFLGVVDLIFCGRHSAEAVGAAGMGNAAFSWIMVAGIGLMAGLDYLVSFSNGTGRREQGYIAWQQSNWLVVGVSLIGIPALYLVAGNLSRLGIYPSVIPGTAAYLRIVAPSLFTVILFQAAWAYLRGLGVVASPVWVLIGMNLLNAFVDYALVLGNFGFPAMGAAGAAWATLLSRTLGAVAIFVLLVWHDRRTDRFTRKRFPIWLPSVMTRLLRLGMPSALQMMLEVGVFATATALAARFAPAELAAHHIALNLASMTFMVPLGVGAAAAVLVGNALGRGARREASAMGWRALSLGMGFMFCSAVVFFWVPEWFVKIYSSDPAVIALGSMILRIAAVFQLADGAQVVLTGALRGWADTRGPMLANLCGHWFIGLPLGVYLGFYRNQGIRGIWTGLATGLVCVALALIWRWLKLSAPLKPQAVA